MGVRKSESRAPTRQIAGIKKQKERTAPQVESLAQPLLQRGRKERTTVAQAWYSSAGSRVGLLLKTRVRLGGALFRFLQEPCHESEPEAGLA